MITLYEYTKHQLDNRQQWQNLILLLHLEPTTSIPALEKVGCNHILYINKRKGSKPSQI